MRLCRRSRSPSAKNIPLGPSCNSHAVIEAPATTPVVTPAFSATLSRHSVLGDRPRGEILPQRRAAPHVRARRDTAVSPLLDPFCSQYGRPLVPPHTYSGIER